MRNTIRTAFGAALALAAAALCFLLTAPSAIAEDSSGTSFGVRKVRLGSLMRDDMVVVDVSGVPGGGGTGGVDTNAVRDIVHEELDRLGPGDIGAMPDDYAAPVTSVNGKTGEVSLVVSDIPGALSTNDVEALIGEYYDTNTSVRIESIEASITDVESGIGSLERRMGQAEGRLADLDGWRSTNALTRAAVESGFTEWVVEFPGPPEGSSPPYDAVVAQVMVDGDPTPTYLWCLFSPTDTVHSAGTALTSSVYAPAGATDLAWDETAWGPVTATRVRVPTVRELDAKAEAKDLQAVAASLSNDVSRLDAALAGTKADLAAVAEAKADRVITEYELAPPRMDTNDVWVVDLDDTVLHFSGEDAVDGFQTWVGTNDGNSVWVCEDGDSNVLARAVSYLLEVTVGPDPVVSSLKVLDVATNRRCGLLTSQFGTAVIVYPPDTLPMDGFKEDDLRYEYDVSAVPAYSKVLLSYRDAGNGNAITNAASIGRGRRRRIETDVVYGTRLEKAVADLRDDLVSRRAIETGFTEWAIESDRPLGEDVVPGLVEGGYVGLWSLFPAGSTDRGKSAALTTTFVGGGVSATNLSWDASATRWGIAVRATRTRVPSMQDLATIENTASSRWDTVSTYLPRLEDYATNNYTAAKLANRRARQLEAWQSTNAITRADIERGITDWAVTPMWPLGRVVVWRADDGTNAGQWSLFRPGDVNHATNLADYVAGDADATNLVWRNVSVSVPARWTNQLDEASGVSWAGPDAYGNVTATVAAVTASRVRLLTTDTALLRAGAAADAKVTGDALAARPTTADFATGFTEWTITRNGVNVTAQVKQPSYDPAYSEWETVVVSADLAVASLVVAPVDATSLEWTGQECDPDEGPGDIVQYTATRTLLRPTKTSQLTNDGAPNGGGTPFQTQLPYPTNAIPYSAVVGTPVKRYPLFVIDLNPGEARIWQHIELKATTNNFTHATASNMLFFTSSTCNETNAASFDLPFTYDWCRLYVMSGRTHNGSGDVRAWTRIRRTGDFINTDPDDESEVTYAPLTLLVIVDPHEEYFKRIPGFAEWLREDNDALTWSYTRIGIDGPEKDQDGKPCWRPAVPVKWYDELPAWALDDPADIDVSDIEPYVPPWSEAIDSADTSYRMFDGVTNVNQSIQFVSLGPDQTSLAVQVPKGGAAKDWVMYAYTSAATDLVLPKGTWWMADPAYTNKIPVNTPTVFYFTTVTNGLYMMSRQALQPVSVK